MREECCCLHISLVSMSRMLLSKGVAAREAMLMSKLYSCEAMDENRLRESYLFAVFGIIFFSASALYLSVAPAPMLVFYCTCGAYLVAIALMQYTQFKCSNGSYRRWNPYGDEVIFGPSLLFVLWEAASALILIVGAIAMVVLSVAEGDSIPVGIVFRVAAFALFLLILAAISLVTLPFGGVSEPDIVLNASEIVLRPGGRYGTRIDWSDRPHVMGGQRRHGRMFVLIEDKNGVRYALPMFTLPLGYVQFERIVEFYSNYPDARQHLGHRSGLVHVRSLMDFPVLEIVGDLQVHGKSGGGSAGCR